VDDHADVTLNGARNLHITITLWRFIVVMAVLVGIFVRYEVGIRTIQYDARSAKSQASKANKALNKLLRQVEEHEREIQSLRGHRGEIYLAVPFGWGLA
jgi:hypothetical protein